jgi:DNA-binding winged helix-turn-helix (wHTH) protein
MNQPTNILNGFRAGQFVLDGDTGELYRDGKLCKRLRPQALIVLVALLERSPGVVKREDLMRLLWGNGQIPEDGLKKIISWLREDLEDSASDPQYIQVLPRIGVRFVAPVEKLQTPSPGPTEIRASDHMPVNETPLRDRITPATNSNGPNVVTKKDRTQLQIQKEYDEAADASITKAYNLRS